MSKSRRVARLVRIRKLEEDVASREVAVTRRDHSESEQRVHDLEGSLTRLSGLGSCSAWKSRLKRRLRGWTMMDGNLRAASLRWVSICHRNPAVAGAPSSTLRRPDFDTTK